MENTSNISDVIPSFIKVKSECGSEVTYYSFLYKGVPKELRFRYEKELNETAEKSEQSLSELKDIIKVDNLKRFSDNILLAVLRSSKFNMKKSESKLRNFIVSRLDLGKKLAAIDMSVVEKVFEDTPVGFLPYRDKHGRAICYSRPYGFHLDKTSIEDLALVFSVMLLFSLSMELTTVAGVVYFAECKSPTLKIFLPIMNMIRSHVLSTLMAFPLRIAKVEILNEISLIRWIFRILRPILPDKLARKVKFIGGYENLTKIYHPDILPEEFGGNLGPLRNDFYKRQLLDFIADLREEGKSITTN